MPLTDLTIEHLWSALSEEEIFQGCIALMGPCHSVLEARRQAAMKRISEIRNIRLNSLRSYSPEKNAGLFLKFGRNSKHQDFWDDIIQAFLLGPKLEVVADFLAAHPAYKPEAPAQNFGFTADPATGGLTILPARHNTDGFFVAIWVRK